MTKLFSMIMIVMILSSFVSNTYIINALEDNEVETEGQYDDYDYSFIRIFEYRQDQSQMVVCTFNNVEEMKKSLM